MAQTRFNDYTVYDATQLLIVQKFYAKDDLESLPFNPIVVDINNFEALHARELIDYTYLGYERSEREFKEGGTMVTITHGYTHTMNRRYLGD